MKYTHSVIILLLVLFVSSQSHAQGWLWGRGNTGAGMDAWPVATDNSGNVFAAGFSWRPYITFGSYKVPFTPGRMQCIVTKYDGSGNFLWARGTLTGDSYLLSITTDPNGNLLMLGAFTSDSLQVGAITLINPISPSSQYFLVKYDPSGNVVWATNAGNALEDSHELGVEILGTGGVATDATGDIYMTVNFQLPIIQVGTITLTNSDPSGTSTDILLAKYDPSGNIMWAKSFGGSDTDIAYGLTVTPAGNVFMAGVDGSPKITFGTSVITNSHAFIAEFDKSGTPLWACGSGTTKGEYAVGIASDAFNNVYMTGAFSGNKITFSGTTIANPNPGKRSLFLVKFDPANNVSWYKTIGSPSGEAWGFSIANSVCGIIWVSGAMQDSVIIDGNILHAPAGSSDPIFIAGYHSNGVYAGSSALQSGGDDQNGIACDALGNIFMCSDYKIDPFVINKDTLAPTGVTERLFVGKYQSLNHGTIDSIYDRADTLICNTSNLVISNALGLQSYLWINGNIGITDTIKAPGKYWVISKKYCSFYFDTIDVKFCTCKHGIPDSIINTCDTLICNATSLTLNARPDLQSYLWSDGNNGISDTIRTEGKYWVVAKNSCSFYYDTFKVIFCNCKNGVPDSIGSTRDTEICNIPYLVLNARPELQSYAWSDGKTGINDTIRSAGTYWVTAKNSCYFYGDTVKMEICECKNDLFLPNSFTPNGDGQNDIFYPRSGGSTIKTIKSFRIYNRWGELVFSREYILPNDASNAWDGTYSGEKPRPDVYVWVTETICNNDKVINRKGSVTIIR